MILHDFLDFAFHKIVNTFPNATIKYEFKKASYTHFFQISPEIIYNNREYINIEIDLEEKFESLQIEDDIAFITDDSLIKLDTPHRVTYPKYVKEGIITNPSVQLLEVLNTGIETEILELTTSGVYDIFVHNSKEVSVSFEDEISSNSNELKSHQFAMAA